MSLLPDRDQIGQRLTEINATIEVLQDERNRLSRLLRDYDKHGDPPAPESVGDPCAEDIRCDFS